MKQKERTEEESESYLERNMVLLLTVPLILIFFFFMTINAGLAAFWIIAAIFSLRLLSLFRREREARESRA